MSFENISTPEKEKYLPKITTEEWMKFSGGDKDDEEFRKWMEAKGIEFENGIAEIELDGDVIKTSEDDFGTIIEDPDIVLEGSRA